MTLSANDFELLLQANRILSSKLNVDDVLQAVLELATKVVRAEAASLLLLDEKTNELYFDVALGSVKDQIKQVRIKVGEGIAGWVAQNMRPLIVNDVSQDPRFAAKVDKTTSFVTRSILAVPMRSKGRLIGVVEAINKENLQPFKPEDQEALGVFASQAGIAIENARLFTAVNAEKKKLDTVFGEMSDGVMVLDDAGGVTIMNHAALQYTELKLDQTKGRKFGPELFSAFQSSVPLGEVLNNDVSAFNLIRQTGKDLILSVTVHKIVPDPDKPPEGWMILLHDSTEERRGEMLKRDFLSLISHKLKTPLTIIMGYVPALSSKGEGLSEFQSKALKAIGEQGSQLNGLIDKLLRFTIVESVILKKDSKPTPVGPLLEQAAEAVKQLPSGQNAKIHVRPVSPTFPKVNVDSSLMVEVFKNLIENAVKFNDKEKKEVEVTTDMSKDSIIIYVRDNGIGIPPEEYKKIFQKFYQIENSFTGQVPGAGLGLALCKRVVEELGGKIKLESKLSKGSTFSVTLPVK